MKSKSSKKDRVVTETYLESKDYVTNSYLEEYLESKHYVTESYLDNALSNYVTKDYLDISLDNLREEMYRHTGALAEHYQHMLSQSMEVIIGQLKEISKKLDKHDHLLSDHDRRIFYLEAQSN